MEIFACLDQGCDAPADAQETTIVGHDQDGVLVWMKPVTCCNGHRYMVEHPFWDLYLTGPTG